MMTEDLMLPDFTQDISIDQATVDAWNVQESEIAISLRIAVFQIKIGILVYDQPGAISKRELQFFMDFHILA